MKFSCYKSDLNEALQFAVRAVAVKPQTPILAGIYLKAEGSTLEVQANNYSTGIIVKIPVNTESPGEVVIGGKRLYDFVRTIPGDTITFSTENSAGTLKIAAGGANVELMTMAAEDFPKVKRPESERSFSVSTKVMHELIRRTVFAVAKEETRPVFTGCAFEIKGDNITLVATNTHRLALAKDKLIYSAPDCNFVVPAETLRGLMQRLDQQRDADNNIKVDYSTRYLTFSFDNVFVNSRLIEGQFPPYDRVIPSFTATNAIVNTEEFKTAVEFVGLMSKETEYNTVKFTLGDDRIEISSNSPEGEGAVKSVFAAVEGDCSEISFNVNYILDVLKVIDSFKLHIALNDCFSPAVFTEPENENYIYVATPVRAE